MKLDNSAKIYPAIMSRSWAAMFRLSASLTEAVDASLLQKAADQTIRRFPSFAQKLRRGFFWHYFEKINVPLRIERDVGNPLVRMNFRESNGYMLRVRYHENRIAVEFFHALTDGTGALTFLRTLVAQYLELKYGAEIPRSVEILDCTEEPKPSENEDGFLKYERGIRLSSKEKFAFRIPGTEDENFLSIVTGLMDVKALLALSKAHGCTLTELLVSVLILSIDEIQLRYVPSRRMHKPVKISVPINLRRFYPTSTVRNFSSYINPGIEPRYGEYSLEETIKRVKGFMASELDEKLLNAKFSTNVNFEKSPFIRAVPLFLKKPLLLLAFYFSGDRLTSSTISNLGKVTLPEEMEKYVTRLDFMLGPLKRTRVACGCISYKGIFAFTFTRKIEEAHLERNFFTRLVKMGIRATVESNQRW
ncbi:MAG: hypothetical protein ACOX8S_10655 [Christensenellales bacterium]